jgi:paired amphipathic helix protein Sin3a
MNSKTRIGSYIKYPDDHLRVISANQHADTNSSWFSLPTGSEDTSFKILRKNEFEDKLFKCEDDIYECDMYISIYTASIEAMEKIKSVSETNQKDVIDPRLFQPARLSAINLYYNDRADEVIEYLHMKPVKTVETILPKLKQRLETYKKQYQESSKHWNDICTKNFSKSLDHRSFYFKQNEKRHIHSKFFIQDIKIRSTERQKQSLNIIKGGCALSPFYISFSALQQPLDEFIIPSDEIANLKEDEARKLSDKLPHYQLLFNDEECFALAISLVLHSISSIANRQQEKDKMMSFLNSVFLHFFEFAIDLEADTLRPTQMDDDDIHYMITDEFKKARIEKPHLSYEQILATYKKSKEPATEQNANKTQAEPEKVPIRVPKSVTRRREEANKLITESKMEDDPKQMKIEKQCMGTMESSLLPVKTPDKKLFYGSQHTYSFLRFFHVLYERLIKVRKLLKDVFLTDALRICPNVKLTDEQQAALIQESFTGIFISIFCSLMKGKLEATKYEDFCKNYMGQKAYLVFTLDKLVNAITKVLQQHLISDDLSHTILDLFIQHSCSETPNSELYLYRFNKAVL